MRIQRVEEYQEFELRTMPHISQMLFPAMPDSNSEPKSSHPKSREHVGASRLRRVWLARRSFVAMEEIHRIVFDNAKSLSDETSRYINSKFGDYLSRHGGWRNFGQDTAYDCMEDMESKTFLQATKGFLAGRILQHCVNNKCSIEDACIYISDNYHRVMIDSDVQTQCQRPDDSATNKSELEKLESIAKQLEGLLYAPISDDGANNLNKEVLRDPFMFQPIRNKYSSDYLREKIWSEMKSVSYAWAAAADIFKDALIFTRRMTLFARPFDYDGANYEAFVDHAKRYYSLATERRQSSEKNLPSLLKNHHDFLFDCEVKPTSRSEETSSQELPSIIIR